MKQNETWGEYLKNSNVRPKTFTAAFKREADGSFVVIGNSAYIHEDINQYDSVTKQVDVRDLAVALNNSRITAR